MDRKSDAPADCALRLGRGDDRAGERVLAVGLDRRGQRGAARRVDRRRPATPVTTGAPRVSVPVLSNSTASTARIRSSASRSFTRMPARADSAVEIAITSGIASPSACGHAITSTVTVRSTASSGIADARPHDERDDAGRRSRRRTGCGGAVGERLARRTRGLRLLHEALDPGERRVVADGVDPDPDRGVGRDGAGDDAVAQALRNRPRLPGDHRLVELRARRRRSRRRRGRARPAARARGRRAERRRRGPCSSPRSVDDARRRPAGARPAPRARRCAWPIAFISCQWPSSMTSISSGELPPEVEIEGAELGGEAGGESDGDREAISSIIPGCRAGPRARRPCRNGQPP